jgi:hypothetical protein
MDVHRRGEVGLVTSEVEGRGGTVTRIAKKLGSPGLSGLPRLPKA